MTPIRGVKSEIDRQGFATFRPLDPSFHTSVDESRALADDFSGTPPDGMTKKWRDKSGAVKHLVNPHWHYPAFRELITCPEVAAICEAFFGPVASFVTHSKISYKVKGRKQVWLAHQDNGYHTRKRKSEILSFAVFLEDCDESNGTICVVPGSHLRGTLPHEIVFVAGEREPQLCVKGETPTDLVSVGGRAGDIMAFHGDTIHSSGTNTRGGNRNIYIFETTPAHSVQLVEVGGRAPLILNEHFGVQESAAPSTVARLGEKVVEYAVMPAAKRALYWSSRAFNYPRHID